MVFIILRGCLPYSNVLKHTRMRMHVWFILLVVTWNHPSIHSSMHACMHPWAWHGMAWHGIPWKPKRQLAPENGKGVCPFSSPFTVYSTVCFLGLGLGLELGFPFHPLPTPRLSRIRKLWPWPWRLNLRAYL